MKTSLVGGSKGEVRLAVAAESAVLGAGLSLRTSLVSCASHIEKVGNTSTMDATSSHIFITYCFRVDEEFLHIFMQCACKMKGKVLSIFGV